jgi:hypothetical protein
VEMSDSPFDQLFSSNLEKKLTNSQQPFNAKNVLEADSHINFSLSSISILEHAKDECKKSELLTDANTSILTNSPLQLAKLTPPKLNNKELEDDFKKNLSGSINDQDNSFGEPLEQKFDVNELLSQCNNDWFDKKLFNLSSEFNSLETTGYTTNTIHVGPSSDYFEKVLSGLKTPNVNKSKDISMVLDDFVNHNVEGNKEISNYIAVTKKNNIDGNTRKKVSICENCEKLRKKALEGKKLVKLYQIKTSELEQLSLDKKKLEAQISTLSSDVVILQQRNKELESGLEKRKVTSIFYILHVFFSMELLKLFYRKPLTYTKKN